MSLTWFFENFLSASPILFNKYSEIFKKSCHGNLRIHKFPVIRKYLRIRNFPVVHKVGHGNLRIRKWGRRIRPKSSVSSTDSEQIQNFWLHFRNVCMTNGEKNVSKKENFCTILSKLKLEHKDMKNSIKNYNISVGDQIQIRMTECLYSYQP